MDLWDKFNNLDENKMIIENPIPLTIKQFVNKHNKNLFEYYSHKSNTFFDMINFEEQIFNNKNVLDVCCGTGVKSIKLLRSYKIKSYTGVDIYYKNLKKAIKDYKLCLFLEKSKNNFPLNIIDNYKPLKSKNAKFILSDISRESFYSNEVISKKFDTILLLDSISTLKKWYSHGQIIDILNKLVNKLNKNGNFIIELNRNADIELKNYLINDLNLSNYKVIDTREYTSYSARNIKTNIDFIVFKCN